jgi:hypothetical protein
MTATSGISAYDAAVTAVVDRVCSNEELFAAANDEIALVAGTLSPRPLVPFICECPTSGCSKIAELSLGEYAALRLFPNRFVVAADCGSGDLAGAQILERTERYTIVDRPID